MYHELTTKDLLAQTRGMLRELEAKLHAHGLQVAMSTDLMDYYGKLKHPNKQAVENARQQIQKDQVAVTEIERAVPVLVAHLAELQALDAQEDAANATDESGTGETEDASAHDSPPEPAASEPPVELATRANGRKREPVPV